MASRALVAMLFLSASLSGCLTEGNGASGDEDGLVVDDSPPYIEDGIFNCLDHDNLTRCWQVHVPENLDPNVTVPLIIDMHGYASNSDEHRKLSSFDDIADEVGAIVVYPDGVAGYNMQWDLEENQAWNSGWCCAHSTRDEIDDVGFIERVVNISLGMYNVDEDRVYASGWSNGCSMSQRLAMESSHIFAAVGCMAFYLITEPVDGYSPIPVMEVHGFLDNVVLYESTVLSVPFNEALWTNSEAYDTGAIENMAEWGDHNNCTGGLETYELNALYTIQGYDGCENDAAVRLMTIYAAQHNPYEKDFEDDTLIGSTFIGTQGLVMSSHIVWDFISQYSKEVEQETEVTNTT